MKYQDRAPVTTIRELYNSRYEKIFNDTPVQKVGFFKRILEAVKPGWADVRRENVALRAKLLAMTREAEDAGKIGLVLYAENEDLRERVLISPDTNIVRASDIDALKRENADLSRKLSRLQEDYGKLNSDVNDWIVKFRPEKLNES